MISLPMGGIHAIYSIAHCTVQLDILRHCSRLKTCRFRYFDCSPPNALFKTIAYEKAAKKVRIVNGISVTQCFSILLEVCGMKIIQIKNIVRFVPVLLQIQSASVCGFLTPSVQAQGLISRLM
jgi:hypothetical protein